MQVRIRSAKQAERYLRSLDVESFTRSYDQYLSATFWSETYYANGKPVLRIMQHGLSCQVYQVN